MSFRYAGRVAIVTGASSGIGRAIALELASRGSTVVGAARRKPELEETIEGCRRTAPASEAVVCDVSDRAAVEDLVRGAIARHGKVDVLVNNAAVPMRVHARRLTVEQVERAMQVNFMGSVYATLAALPSMLERREGWVVNISSVAGRIGNAREAAYTASKFAMVGWSEVLAADLAGSGVRVHVVYPGPIDTEIWNKVDEPPAYRGKRYPPEMVARAVCACLERGRFERWAPGNLRAVPVWRALAPDAFIRGLVRYDRKRLGEP